jgi:hypothetical protein
MQTPYNTMIMTLKRLVAALALLLAPCLAASGSTVQFATTNFTGAVLTNNFIVWPAFGPTFNGIYLQAGIPILVTNYGGLGTNVLLGGTYGVKLQDMPITPGGIGTNYFVVPNDSLFYQLDGNPSLLVPGGNFFSYRPSVSLSSLIAGLDTNTMTTNAIGVAVNPVGSVVFTNDQRALNLANGANVFGGKQINDSSNVPAIALSGPNGALRQVDDTFGKVAIDASTRGLFDQTGTNAVYLWSLNTFYDTVANNASMRMSTRQALENDGATLAFSWGNGLKANTIVTGSNQMLYPDWLFTGTNGVSLMEFNQGSGYWSLNNPGGSGGSYVLGDNVGVHLSDANNSTDLSTSNTIVYVTKIVALNTPGFTGDGSGLTGIPTNAVTGLPNLITNIITGTAPQPLGGSVLVSHLSSKPSGPGPQLGIETNGTYGSLYWSTGPNAGNWSGIWWFDGTCNFGSFTNMPVGSQGHAMYANGYTNVMSTNTPANGGTLGAETTLLISQPDPKQAAYIGFASPKSGNGPLLTMGSGTDFQVGLGGWCYGSNTLSALALTYDGLITMNPPVNFHITTTGDSGGFGARDVYSYDNNNSIHHWAQDIVGNGAFANAGYLDLWGLDAKLRIFTNNAATFFNTNFTANGSFTANGTTLLVGTTTLGNNGTGNTGSISGGLLKLNTAGTPSAPTLLVTGNSYLNVDSGANLFLGHYSTGTTNDYMITLQGNNALVAVNTNLTVTGPTVSLTQVSTNAPANTNIVRGWITFTVQGVTGKVPFYQ